MASFSDTLMDYFQYPRNRGATENADAIGRGSLNGHPPFVTLYLRLKDSCILGATFEAEGCGVTIACASMLTEMISDQEIGACKAISRDTLVTALDGIPSGKEYCAVVALAALEDALLQT